MHLTFTYVNEADRLNDYLITAVSIRPYYYSNFNQVQSIIDRLCNTL